MLSFLKNIFKEYKEFFETFDVSVIERVKTTLFDARFSLITCILTGLGRALSEVGAIIIVGVKYSSLYQSYDNHNCLRDFERKFDISNRIRNDSYIYIISSQLFSHINKKFE